MKCMGLDLATRSGWGFGERTGTPMCGAFVLSGLDEETRPFSCASLYSAVKSLVSANSIKGLAIEHPLFHMKKNSNPHKERSAMMLLGAAQAGGAAGGVTHFWLPYPNEWRAEVLGNGYPKNAKQAACDYVKLVYGIATTDHDMAEGICVMAFAHGQAKLI